MNRFIFRSALCCAMLLMLVACNKPTPMAIIDGFAQGTTYHIVVVGCDDAQPLKAELDSLLDDISSSMSLFDEHSLINALNANKTDSLDDYIARCIEYAEVVSRQSRGNYDITIKPLVQARGFLADSASSSYNVDSLLQYVGYQKIRANGGRLVKDNPNVQIDLSSIAQGYTADVLAEFLMEKGYADFLVEIGGEIKSQGQKPDGQNWRIGIDKPADGNVVPGAELQVKLSMPSGRGLATSGNYRKFYFDDKGNKVVHTISPLTGQSVISNLLSATVMAENATLADAYGTMLMVLGLDGSIKFLADHPEVDAYLVYGEQGGGMGIYATEGMQKCIIE